MPRPMFAAGLVAALALVACGGGDGDDPAPPAADGGECTADTKMDVYSTDHGVVHTDHPSYAGPLGHPPRYTVEPPSGGDHLSPSVRPGLYEADNVPHDGALVHSLEHGYVILWFSGDEAPEAFDDVRDRFRRDVIVVQRPSMLVPVAATAWGHRLLCQEADAATLSSFVERRRNQAPEKVPH